MKTMIDVLQINNSRSEYNTEQILIAMSEWAAIQCEAKDKTIDILHRLMVSAEQRCIDKATEELAEKDKEIKELKGALNNLLKECQPNKHNWNYTTNLKSNQNE